MKSELTSLGEIILGGETTSVWRDQDGKLLFGAPETDYEDLRVCTLQSLLGHIADMIFTLFPGEERFT